MSEILHIFFHVVSYHSELSGQKGVKYEQVEYISIGKLCDPNRGDNAMYFTIYISYCHLI